MSNILKSIVDDRNLSISALSRLTNVHNRTLIKYLECGGSYFDNGRLRVYWKIATGLEINVENLLISVDWLPSTDIITSSISLKDAVDRKAIWLHTSSIDIHNNIREILNLSDYATFSAYENYRWVPTISDALKIAQYLNCTINALWGNYFKEMENAR